MKILYALIIVILFSSMSYAQIGIGTIEPKTTLDVQGEPANTALADGVRLPSMSLAELEAKITATTSAYNADHDGVMVFINDVTAGSTIAQTAGITSKGIYFFSHDGTTGQWYAVGENKLWSTSGNAGTDETTEFIGTTDNVALNFRVNNTKAGRIGLDGDNSLFLGFEAGLSDDLTFNRNVFIGYQAGRENTIGFDNTAVGNMALYYNTVGSYNTAFGNQALVNNTSGDNNNAVGYLALVNNTRGSENTANGYQALYLNTTGDNNTANGSRALYLNRMADNNTANGFEALYNNNTGYNNTANGSQALFSNSTGFRNTANGFQALYSNNSGTRNTAIGNEALRSNRDGNRNTAIGAEALFSNTTGIDNTATGNQALYANITGEGNTAYGYRTLRNSSSSFNTAFGYESLDSNTSGLGNVAVGVIALESNLFGDNNTAVGFSAFSIGTNYSNSSAVGFNAQPSASNTIRLGNIGISSIGGYEPWTNLSDGRFKQNVQENVVGLEFIKKLRPVTYKLDMDALAKFNKTPDSLRLRDAEQLKAAELQTGFIAQEVEQAAKEVGFDFHGVDKPKNAQSHYGLRYAEFVVPLVKAVQEQQEEIVKQNEEIESLKKLIETQQSQIKQLMDKFAEE